MKLQHIYVTPVNIRTLRDLPSSSQSLTGIDALSGVSKSPPILPICRRIGLSPYAPVALPESNSTDEGIIDFCRDGI